MATTKKAEYKDNLTANNDFLNSIRNNADIKEPATASEPTRHEKATADTGSNATEKKTLFNIKVNESTLKDWKQFCLDYDMTLTAAIKRAMQRFIKDIKSGNADL